MLACPSCGERNPLRARFCLACGVRLGAAQAPPEERKVVTVLFADVVGFTSLAERLDPEDVRALLTPFYSLIRSVLARYGGAIEQFTGDGVMALFGAPAAHEDDPERAVRAALAIREEIQRRNEEDAGFQLDIRAGVNTGEVLISHDATGRLVAGDAVNTAQRLQTNAPVNGILVGEDTHRATARFIEYRSVGRLDVKGKAEPVRAWEALAPFARFGPEVVRETSGPLVGRQVELSLLEGMLQRTREAAESQLVSLIGAPGIGKSRLLAEIFLRGMRDTPGLVYWRQGRCPPYGERAAFSALGDMVRAQAGILDTDSAAEAAGKLHAALERLGDDTDWIERHLRPLAGLAEDRAGDRPGEAFAAWRRFFECLARDRPLVLVFEDLHWADDGLLDFVDQLVERSRELPVLVVCTARPELLERRPGWGGGKRNATTISLGPLSEPEMTQLVEGLLAGVDAGARRVEEIVERAEGNPLYAEEFVQMLRDRGASEPAAGVDEPLPLTVQGIVAARIDALPPEEKALLVDASVVGKLFWEGALAALADTRAEGDERRALLRSLERRELIRRERVSTVAGEDEYAFRHALVREVAYRLLPRSRRAKKHLLAAAWIELLARGRDDHAEARADHYLAALSYSRDGGGQISVKAAHALREAGERAIALAAPVRAAQYLEQSLELLPRNDAQRPYVLLAHGRALYRKGGDSEATFEQARAGLLGLGDREQAGEADVALAFAHFSRGRIDDSFACLERAAELLRDAPPSPAKVLVLSTLASFLLLADRRAAALATGEQALAMADDLDDDNLRARSLRIVGAARAASGDTAGVEQLERSIEIARRVNSFEAVPALANLAATYVSFGDLPRAFELQQQAVEQAEAFADTPTVHWLNAERVAEHYWLGRWDEAIAASDELLALRQGAYIDAIMRVVRAKIALARGDAGAVAEAERALRAARQRKESQFFFPALATAARTFHESGRDGADGLLDEFLSLLTGEEIDLGAYWADLAVVAVGLGRAADLIEAIGRVRAPTRWVDAAEAIAHGDYVVAASTYAEIGSRPDEAWARLRAACALHDLGERDRSASERAAACAFFEEVGARAYVEAARAGTAA